MRNTRRYLAVSKSYDDSLNSQVKALYHAKANNDFELSFGFFTQAFGKPKMPRCTNNAQALHVASLAFGDCLCLEYGWLWPRQDPKLVHLLEFVPRLREQLKTTEAVLRQRSIGGHGKISALPAASEQTPAGTLGTDPAVARE